MYMSMQSLMVVATLGNTILAQNSCISLIDPSTFCIHYRAWFPFAAGVNQLYMPASKRLQRPYMMNSTRVEYSGSRQGLSVV